MSDAGLGSSLQRMSISEGNISRQYELLNTNDHQATITKDSANGVAFNMMNCIEEYCDSLEIFCPKRVSNTQQALDQVADLMLKLENCENLFPSSRDLVATNATWGDEEFKMRFLL